MREQKADESTYRFGYQGQFSEKDIETGWSHFELREYDPVIARWTSTDPYGQFWSPYVGMGNDPVNATDPDGGCTGDCPPEATLSHDSEGAVYILPEAVLVEQGYRNFDQVISGWQSPGHLPSNDLVDPSVYSPAAGTWDTYTPLISVTGGDIIVDAVNVYRDLNNGDYWSAAKDVGYMAVPFISSSYYQVGKAATQSLGSVAKVPEYAQKIARTVAKTGRTLQGYVSKNFQNRESKLPKLDPNNKPITYKEYDVHPQTPGVNRGAERVVIGSDGRQYYTDDHYSTFTEFN